MELGGTDRRGVRGWSHHSERAAGPYPPTHPPSTGQVRGDNELGVTLWGSTTASLWPTIALRLTRPIALDVYLLQLLGEQIA